MHDLSKLTFLSDEGLDSPHIGAFVLELTAPLGDLSPYRGRATIEEGLTRSKERLRKELLKGANDALVNLPARMPRRGLPDNVVSLFGRRAQ